MPGENPGEDSPKHIHYAEGLPTIDLETDSRAQDTPPLQQRLQRNIPNTLFNLLTLRLPLREYRLPLSYF